MHQPFSGIRQIGSNFETEPVFGIENCCFSGRALPK